MKIVQILPALNSGGVERGTIDFARYLQQQGHQSIVISNGGRQVASLLANDCQHIQLPVHKKSLFSLATVKPLRRTLAELQPDLIHVRSRLPAWLVFLANRSLDIPVVSTFHGCYSVNAYSNIMTKADAIIAISEHVKQYIEQNYRPKATIELIYRGVDNQQFYPRANSPQWQQQLYAQYPALAQGFILMPGRLSPWKGQQDFLILMRKLHDQGLPIAAAIVGEAEANKEGYLQELHQLRRELGLEQQVCFLGHRSDMAELYNEAKAVCHLSRKPEPFGRTLTEALACNTPVLAYAQGGAAESLQQCFPAGLVPVGDLSAFAQQLRKTLEQSNSITLPEQLTFSHQAAQTLALYQNLISGSRG